VRNLSEENGNLRAILLDILSKWERENTEDNVGRGIASASGKSENPDTVSPLTHPTWEEPVFTTTTMIVGPGSADPVPSPPVTVPAPPSSPSPVPGDTPLEDTVIIDTLKEPGFPSESGGGGPGAGGSPATGTETDDLEKTMVLRAEGSSSSGGAPVGQTPVPVEEGPGRKKENFLDKTLVLKDGKVLPEKKP